VPTSTPPTGWPQPQLHSAILPSDGRPILSLDSSDLLEIALLSTPDSYPVPAHIWTSRFAVLGSQSGDAWGDSLLACLPGLAAVRRALSHRAFYVILALFMRYAMCRGVAFRPAGSLMMNAQHLFYLLLALAHAEAAIRHYREQRLHDAGEDATRAAIYMGMAILAGPIA
jgi:hypothetical protein